MMKMALIGKLELMHLNQCTNYQNNFYKAVMLRKYQKFQIVPAKMSVFFISLDGLTITNIDRVIISLTEKHMPKTTLDIKT